MDAEERGGDRRFKLVFPHGDEMPGPVWGDCVEGEREAHGHGRGRERLSRERLGREAGSEAEDGRGSRWPGRSLSPPCTGPVPTGAPLVGKLCLLLPKLAKLPGPATPHPCRPTTAEPPACTQDTLGGRGAGWLSRLSV